MSTEVLTKITALEFWASEYMLPLFWLTYPQHQIIIGNDVLFLYQESVTSCYYLNSRMTAEIEKGYAYFSRPGSFADYVEEASRVIKDLETMQQKYRAASFREFSDQDMAQVYDQLVALGGDFMTTYVQTEGIRLTKFENISDPETNSGLFQVGKMRFALRSAVEPLLKILLGSFAAEVASRYHLSVADWFFYTHQETLALFNGEKLDARIIALRQLGYAWVNLGGKCDLLVGDGYFAALALVNRFTAHDRTELKGKGVMPGKARGKVSLLKHDVGDLTAKCESFGAGDILVTEMTTPGTLLACRKALAIVTDEGGILSHAAIIARELKKPCIVGTKIATQILHDGDEVEVDADNGIVRILKRN